MNFELDYIEKLVKLVSESDLTELTLEEGEEAPAQSAAPAEEKKEDAPKGKPITSPMVGTFYLASSPGAKPFVEVGATVSTGQVVCIIEAMKLMNEIESEVSGKVTQICVKDGEAVEYGQVLMYVE